MINKRLIVSQHRNSFHFNKWEKHLFKKYFREVVYHSLEDDPRCEVIKKDDVLFVYAMITLYNHVKSANKFGIFYPGFGFNPFKIRDKALKSSYLFDVYDAIFMNEGPVWETFKHLPNAFLVGASCDPNIFKKTRKRDTFKKIIQVAGKIGPFKGRHISTEVFKSLPYDSALVPADDNPVMYIPFEELPSIYQNADGCLFPNMIGPPPEYQIDAKYNQSNVEAGMSGCIIFWHDCMELGNSMETVFEIPLDPPGIIQKIQEVVGSIDLEKHSILTAQEFYEKCNMHDMMKYKVDIMKRFL